MKRGMNKGGQFFILAAVILSTFLFSLAFTMNEVVATQEDLGFHNYAQGLEREVDTVLDYQVYSNVPFANLSNFIAILEADFKDRGGQGDFVFIYGNSTQMTIKNSGVHGIDVGDEDVTLKGSGDSEESTIRIGGFGVGVFPENEDDTEIVFDEDDIIGDKIDIYFNEESYTFPVSHVNQVIFLIQKDVGEEIYVEVR